MAEEKKEISFVELKFSAITDYGFEDVDQNTAKVHILKGLEGIKNSDPNNIQCDFEPYSFDLKIRDFKGKNLRFRVDPLFGSLAVEGCKLTIKSNSISLTLRKENPAKWS